MNAQAFPRCAVAGAGARWAGPRRGRGPRGRRQPIRLGGWQGRSCQESPCGAANLKLLYPWPALPKHEVRISFQSGSTESYSFFLRGGGIIKRREKLKRTEEPRSPPPDISPVKSREFRGESSGGERRTDPRCTLNPGGWGL